MNLPAFLLGQSVRHRLSHIRHFTHPSPLRLTITSIDFSIGCGNTIHILLGWTYFSKDLDIIVHWVAFHRALTSAAVFAGIGVITAAVYGGSSPKAEILY
jgi:hypothetical protein